MTHIAFVKKAIFALAALYLCSVFASSMFVSQVAAQEAVSCSAEYEVMMRLRSPSSGSYSVWDGTYGNDVNDEGFIGGELLSNGHVIVAGQKPAGADGVDHLVLLEMDRRGRTVWQKAHDIKGLQSVRHMMRLGTNFVVSGDIRTSKSLEQVWLGFFNAKGELISTRILRDPRLNLAGDAIALAPRKNTFYMAVAKTDRKGGETYSLLYHLDSKGRTLSTRSYRLGASSRVLGLHKTDDDELIAVGWIEASNGREQGWVLQMDQELKLIWQQTVSRGGKAHLRDAVMGADGHVIVIGDVVSVDGGQQAAFVFKMNGRSGQISWQRYYKDDHKVSARQIVAHSQNKAGHSYSLLIDTVGKETLEMDEFARVLQINERGVILDAKNLFFGRGVHAMSIFSGYNDERVVVGAADVEKVDNQAAGEEPVMMRSRDGVVIAVPAPSFYADPCVQPSSANRF